VRLASTSSRAEGLWGGARAHGDCAVHARFQTSRACTYSLACALTGASRPADHSPAPPVTLSRGRPAAGGDVRGAPASARAGRERQAVWALHHPVRWCRWLEYQRARAGQVQQQAAQAHCRGFTQILYYCFVAARRRQSSGAASVRSHQEPALTRLIAKYLKLLAAPGLCAQCVASMHAEGPVLQLVRTADSCKGVLTTL